MASLDDLLTIAAAVGGRLRDRNETVAIAESSSGGLVAAALLSQPGASSFFIGGGVIYTRQARSALLDIGDPDMAGLQSSTEPYARLLARSVRQRLGATWGIGETGAAGPSANRYGDQPGHSCIAVSGPFEAARTIATGQGGRFDNMLAFASSALTLLLEQLATA